MTVVGSQTFPPRHAWVARTVGVARGLGEAPAADHGRTILVVDDDPGILGMVGSLLELHGYGVRLAAGGAEALAALEREIPVLVLLDMRMRGTDGWAVAAAIRARGLVLPVVVMTAAQDARLWAEEIGADGYIAKPFHIDELLKVVRSHVRPHGN